MKQLAEQAKQGNLTEGELEELNVKLNNLLTQVRALDGESRKIEDERILEWALMAGKMAISAHFAVGDRIQIVFMFKPKWIW